MSPAYQQFLDVVTVRSEWLREDLANEARTCGVMLEGAIEALNEWALDLWDSMLVEGSDKLLVNAEIVALSMAGRA